MMMMVIIAILPNNYTDVNNNDNNNDSDFSFVFDFRLIAVGDETMVTILK